MEDRASILDNIHWPPCVVKELKREEKNMADDDNNEDLTINIPTSLSVLSFTFIDPKAVRRVEDENLVCLSPCQLLEDCLQYHDELLEKSRSDQSCNRVHDKIGVPNCGDSAPLHGQCKMAFRDKFSKELVDKYSAVAGMKNFFGEDYWRGPEIYKKPSAEAVFYDSYRILKGAQSHYTGYYINKI